MAPLLSICIPTYNRADLLKLALVSVSQQTKGFDGLVEVIVSDNGSSDDTESVCKSILADMQWAKYHRNSHNLGVTANILATILLSSGKFCWIIGDDDMIVNGKLPEILTILKANQDLDYFFVNYFFKSIAERNKLITDYESKYTPQANECMCKDFSQRRVNKWEDLLEIENVHPEAMFTAIVSHIFKRELWLSKSELLLARNADGFFDVIDCNFPQIEVIAHGMVGHPAYYIGTPCILLGLGSQEWSEKWPLFMVNDLSRMLEMYRQLGISNKLVNRLERMLINRQSNYIVGLVAPPHTGYRADFSLREFIWRNRFNPLQVTRLLLRIAKHWLYLRLPRRVKRLTTLLFRVVEQRVFPWLPEQVKRVLLKLYYEVLVS
jgi:glycosyltransferase involved in cell wall biosynthesis